MSLHSIYLIGSNGMVGRTLRVSRKKMDRLQYCLSRSEKRDTAFVKLL